MVSINKEDWHGTVKIKLNQYKL